MKNNLIGSHVSNSPNTPRSFSVMTCSLLGMVALLLLGGCGLSDKMATFHFPDATFSVPRRWVPNNVYGSGMLSIPAFEFHVPAERVPRAAFELSYKGSATSGVPKNQYTYGTYQLHVAYRKTPRKGEALSSFLQKPGWSLLPEHTDHEYLIVQSMDEDDGFDLLRRRLYVVKSDSRYSILCSTRIKKLDSSIKKEERCLMEVPYKDFVGEKCAQIAIGFDYEYLRRWREIANHKREILKQFEIAKEKN